MLNNYDKWQININQTVQELENIAENLDVPKDYLTCVNDPFEIARFEDQWIDSASNNSLIVLQYVFSVTKEMNHSEYQTRPVSIVRTDNKCMLTMKEVPIYFEGIVKDLEDNRSLEYEELVMKIFWKIQNETIKVLAWIHQEIEDMQADIEYSSQNKELYRLMALDRTLAYINTAIQNNRTVLEGISKKENFTSDHHLRSLMHDVLIESYQAESMVKEGMRIAEQLSNIYSNVISNNLNNVMKRLTSITIILTIPTIIGGLWGMNVPVPFEENNGGFLTATLICIVLSGIVWVWLKYKDYI